MTLLYTSLFESSCQRFAERMFKDAWTFLRIEDEGKRFAVYYDGDIYANNVFSRLNAAIGLYSAELRRRRMERREATLPKLTPAQIAVGLKNAREKATQRASQRRKYR